MVCQKSELNAIDHDHHVMSVETLTVVPEGPPRALRIFVSKSIEQHKIPEQMENQDMTEIVIHLFYSYPATRAANMSF